MDNEVRITVVTVTKNCESTLQRAIDSVRNQHYDNLQYIIIDGQSTDGTIDVINQNLDVVDTFISEPDNGIFDAMNKGINLADGELIAFLGSDDSYLPGVLSVIRDYYISKRADVLYGDYCITTNGSTHIVNTGDYDVNDFKYRMLSSHQAIFTKCSLMKKYGFDTQYSLAADYNYILKLYYEGYSLVHVPCNIVEFGMDGASQLNIDKAYSEVHIISDRMAKKYMSIEQYENFNNSNYKEKLFTDFILRVDDELTNVDDDFLKKKLDRLTPLYIMGTGNRGVQCAKTMTHAGIHIDGFMDNNPDNSNGYFSAMKVERPEDIENRNDLYVIISSPSNEVSIRTQLEQTGFDGSKILSFYRLAIEDEGKNMEKLTGKC